jgi:hypothetical protein
MGVVVVLFCRASSGWVLGGEEKIRNCHQV